MCKLYKIFGKTNLAAFSEDQNSIANFDINFHVTN